MLYRLLEGNSDNDPDVVQFAKQYRKALYKDGNTKKPIYHFIENEQGNPAIGKCDGGRMKEVVHKQRAIEIVESIHRPGGKGCRPGRQKLVRKTFMEKYCISGITQIVNDVLASCTGTCKETIRLSVQHPPPTPIRTSAVMERIQIDITEVYGPSSPFLESASHPYSMILVIKDCFSKFCWLTPIKNKEASTVASVLTGVFRTYGCPQILQSDNGGEFIAKVIKTLCANFNVTIKHGSPYKPQTQGQIENLNKRVKRYLAARLLDFAPQEQTNVWPVLLPEISNVINNTYHFTTQSTPFHIFFGRPSRLYSENSDMWPSDDILVGEGFDDSEVYSFSTADLSDSTQQPVFQDLPSKHKDVFSSVTTTAETESLLYSLIEREVMQSNVIESAERMAMTNYFAHVRKLDFDSTITISRFLLICITLQFLLHTDRYLTCKKRNSVPMIPFP